MVFYVRFNHVDQIWSLGPQFLYNPKQKRHLSRRISNCVSSSENFEYFPTAIFRVFQDSLAFWLRDELLSANIN